MLSKFALTRDSIKEIVHSQRKIDKAVVQIIEIKEAKKKTPKSTTRYKVAISDGNYWTTAILNTSFNPKVESQEIKENTIICITQYNVTKANENMIFFIIGLDVVKPAYSKIIGSPQNVKVIKDLNEFQEIKESPLIKPNFLPETPIIQSNNLRDTPSISPCPSGRTSSSVSPIQTTNNLPSFSSISKNPGFQGVKSPPRSPLILNIGSLSLYVLNWIIQVKVTNKSEIHEFHNGNRNGKLFSVILQDKEGSLIKGTAFNREVDRLYDRIDKGNVYKVSGGKLHSANKKYNNTGCDLEITFTEGTEFEYIDNDESISFVSYNFIPFSELPTTQLKTVDIIGIILEISSIVHFQSKRNIDMIRRNLKLCDQTGTIVEVTLWNKEAEEFSEDNINSIIALKGATISRYTGVSISCNSNTIITLNPTSHPQAAQLLQWWSTEGQIAFQSDSFQSLSNLSSNSAQHILLSSLNTMLSQNQSNLENFTFSCYGVVSQFSLDRKMYYLACPNPDCHFKGVKETIEGFYVCPNCNETIAQPVPRYSFSFRLMDMTGSTYASVIGSDDIGKVLLGRNAQEWWNEFHDKEENFILEKIKNYLFKLLKFKIRTRIDNYNGSPSPKLTVLNVEEPDFSKASKLFLSEINKS